MSQDLAIINDMELLSQLTKGEVRELIAKVEAAALLSTTQIEVPITHHFSKAVYAREMKLPKGALIVGKIHKFENLNILSQGEVSVLSIDGVKRVKAPHTFVASSGAKRMIYAHEDCVWTTVHGTELRDVDKIEDEFIVKTYDELPLLEGGTVKIEELKCLG